MLNIQIIFKRDTKCVNYHRKIGSNFIFISESFSSSINPYFEQLIIKHYNLKYMPYYVNRKKNIWKHYYNDISYVELTIIVLYIILLGTQPMSVYISYYRNIYYCFIIM